MQYIICHQEGCDKQPLRSAHVGEYIVGVSTSGAARRSPRCKDVRRTQPLRLQGCGPCVGRGDLSSPLPRRSIYILEGQARHQSGYTHGLEWPAKRTFAVVESDGRAALANVSRHEGVEPVLFCLEVLSPKASRYADVLPKLCPAGRPSAAARADAPAH